MHVAPIQTEQSLQETDKMSSLRGKSAVVTGASKGIGAGIAKALA